MIVSFETDSDTPVTVPSNPNTPRNQTTTYENEINRFRDMEWPKYTRESQQFLNIGLYFVFTTLLLLMSISYRGKTTRDDRS